MHCHSLGLFFQCSAFRHKTNLICCCPREDLTKLMFPDSVYLSPKISLHSLADLLLLLFFFSALPSFWPRARLVQWHCNFYSLFRSFWPDRNSHFMFTNCVTDDYVESFAAGETYLKCRLCSRLEIVELKCSL